MIGLILGVIVRLIDDGLGDVLDELVKRSANSAEVSAKLVDFLNKGPVLNSAEIDHDATRWTGETAIRCEPSDSLRNFLAALRARDSHLDDMPSPDQDGASPRNSGHHRTST